MAGGFTLEIDSSDMQKTLNSVKGKLSKEQMQKLMRRVYSRAGGTVRRAVGQAVPRQYYVTSTEARKATGSPNIAGMGCTIPIRGVRLSVGEKFKATGSARGWASKKKKYKVKAKIVKGQESVMPDGAFRNSPSSLGKQAYKRDGGGRLPIKRIVGPAVPQMAETRAAPDIQKEVKSTIEKRLAHEIEYMMGQK